MRANFGGTEPLPAIKAAIEQRCKGANLEIMVLTDGEVWDTGPLFQYVERQTAKGDVRLFSLGIGHDVSHSLIDGLARVGRGFSQVVSDEREGMESKVARMLRGGLSPHVLNYRLEWDGKPGEAALRPSKKPPSPFSRALRINLFDTSANRDTPASFTPPPQFDPPSILQAPYKLQPLFPFSRTTAYVIFSSSDVIPPPSRVWLRGTTPEGDELELEIEVHVLEGKADTIHQLAARKILQELKEGTGYLHGGGTSSTWEGGDTPTPERVKQEGVRVGLKYGVASEWTSFVAVIKKEGEEEAREVAREIEESDDELMDDFVDLGREESPTGKLSICVRFADINTLSRRFSSSVISHKSSATTLSFTALPLVEVLPNGDGSDGATTTSNSVSNKQFFFFQVSWRNEDW